MKSIYKNLFRIICIDYLFNFNFICNEKQDFSFESNFDQHSFFSNKKKNSKKKKEKSVTDKSGGLISGVVLFFTTCGIIGFFSIPNEGLKKLNTIISTKQPKIKQEAMVLERKNVTVRETKIDFPNVTVTKPMKPLLACNTVPKSIVSNNTCNSTSQSKINASENFSSDIEFINYVPKEETSLKKKEDSKKEITYYNDDDIMMAYDNDNENYNYTKTSNVIGIAENSVKKTQNEETPWPATSFLERTGNSDQIKQSSLGGYTLEKTTTGYSIGFGLIQRTYSSQNQNPS